MPPTLLRLNLTLLAVAGLAGCAHTGRPSAPLAGPATSVEAAPQPVVCPKGLPAATRCLGGQDSAGAHYLIAQPADWNGRLVLHAHGGPELGTPSAARTADDLSRWAIMVRAGYAWAGSSFRQGGVAVRAAAEDTERLRGIYRRHVAQPQRTYLHGQSWGASVAAKAAELFTHQTVGETPYDGVLLTSGVLGGGTRSYDVRTDLRVLYQHLCHNHPRPSEPAYNLTLGLPAQARMTHADLRARVNECLALDRPAAQRSPAQQAKVETLVQVLKLPESSLQAHMNWATFHFQDISSHRTGGASPFGNQGAVYSGSGDDAALNAAVLRYRADPQAFARLAADTDLSGAIPVPVLTVKWIGDPTAFVELDAQFKTTMDTAGRAHQLVQTFTTQGTHSYISDPTYPTLMAALQAWVEHGQKPSPAHIAQTCDTHTPRFGPGCSFAPHYTPAPLASRVPVRERERP